MGLLFQDFKPTPLFWLIAVAIYGAAFGGIGYVCFHFISKYW